MEAGEVWPAGENAYVQIVTYSGHAPFRLPENLRRISFSEDVPQLMADYMITANYTDAAIGRLVGYLQSRSDYAHTMIVITGDHEGQRQAVHAVHNPERTFPGPLRQSGRTGGHVPHSATNAGHRIFVARAGSKYP